MGVRRAPPRLSSEPRPPFWKLEVALPHDTDRGFMLPPFDRTAALERSGIAGGRGKVFAPDVTWTTRSTACKYEGRER